MHNHIYTNNVIKINYMQTSMSVDLTREVVTTNVSTKLDRITVPAKMDTPFRVITKHVLQVSLVCTIQHTSLQL